MSSAAVGLASLVCTRRRRTKSCERPRPQTAVAIGILFLAVARVPRPSFAATGLNLSSVIYHRRERRCQATTFVDCDALEPQPTRKLREFDCKCLRALCALV